ncbi:MAG: PIN domain-containing protein [Chloroflexota bacterium]|nr:MAG: PIN domain-containing protein [Chloroflexota bacterium]
MIILDTSGLLAAIDGSQRHHAEAAASIRTAGGPLLLSPFVLAELDYLLSTRVSQPAALALLDQVAAGAYRLEPMDLGDIARASEIILRYRDLRLGLADASLVVLAERHGTLDILTLDERHFRAIEGPGGRPFRLLPADKD